MLNKILGPSGIVRVQSWDVEARAPSSVEDLVGVTWPQRSGAVASGRVDIICVGPADWLILTAEPDATPWLHHLDVLFQHSTFRATNVSQALSRIQVEGAEVRDLLSNGCALDFHPPLFLPGHSARTRLAGMAVIVRCIRHSSFELMVTSSYANYLMAWLDDAALQFETAT